MWEAALLHLGLAILGVCLTWTIQCFTRNGGIVDISWTLIVGMAAVVYGVAGTGDTTIRWIVVILGASWALRLGGYLAARNIGKPEDRRYAELRRKWGRRANLNMLGFYLFQGVIAWILGLSFLPIAFHAEQPGLWLVVAGIAISGIGILGEGIADRQLARFLAEPMHRGRVCDVGLWRYSRHPNYFFECLHWLGYPLLAFGAPLWGLSLIGAVLIPWLLLKLSGIPTVEARDARMRRVGYDEYMQRTSAFIPLPPRKMNP